MFSLRLIKRLIVLCLLPVLYFPLMAQDSKISSSTKMFLLRMNELQPLNPEDSNKIKKLQKEYPVFVQEKKLMIGAMLQVNDKIRIKKLQKMGIQVNTRTDGIISARVPVTKVEKLVQIRGIIFVDVDKLINTKP